MSKNEHNLSRTIPETIKLQVRKNSGYGCVICGTAIIEYEHVFPEFKDCKEHDPNNITLLCPTCHSKKTRGFLSIEAIRNAMKSPKPKQLGFSMEVLDIGDKPPTIYFAGSVMKFCKIPLMVSNIPIIQISSPESIAGPYLLSALFYNRKGELSLKIDKNEWFSYTSNWDLEVTSGRIKIKDSKNTFSLILKTIGYGEIEVELIDSIIGHKHLQGNKNEISITNLLTGGKISYIQNVHFGSGLKL